MWRLPRVIRPGKAQLLAVPRGHRWCSRYLSATAHRTSSASLMDTSCLSETQIEIRDAVFKVCSDFPDEYWAKKDDTGEYPLDFHAAMARAGFIGVALPEDLGGSGLGISEAAAMLEAVAESGAGFAGAQTLHANIYATQPIARFGSAEQKKTILPDIISGDCRMCFGVTEPNTGLDTRKLRTKAVPTLDGYLITGDKIWISSAQVAHRMLLLARTEPGLSLFCIPLDRHQKPSSSSSSSPPLRLAPIRKMGGRAVDANEVTFDGYAVSSSTLIGREGQGWDMVLHGMNAERCLIAAEALGLGYAALRRAAAYVRQREVFGRPVGGFQGVAHPLAEAWMQLEAAKGMVFAAASRFDAARGGDGSRKADTGVGLACNAAKFLAAEAAGVACERAVLAMGGMGYAREFHVERYLRESFVPRIAPVSREMIKNFVAEKALGLPRSY